MVKFRRDSKGKFRWRIVADDGRILGVGLNGEDDKEGCEKNLREIYEEIGRWIREGSPKTMDVKPRTTGEWRIKYED